MKVQKHLPVVSASGLKVLDLLNKHFFFTTRAPSVGEEWYNCSAHIKSTVRS